MYCVNCGAQLPPDSRFCTVCGAKLENDSTPIASPDVGPIAPPPMNVPYGYGQQPPQKKKSKALLWILIGVAAVLIAAAVLYFVVFAPGGAGPFSGNTVQTRFANDAVGVFTGAFDGLSSDTPMNQIIDKPFDLELNYSTDMSGIKTEMAIDAAYDEKALGMNVTTFSDYSDSEFAEYFADMDNMESTVKLLLLEDVFYVDQDNITSGLKFDSTADLSESMPLKQRIAALFENEDAKAIDFKQLIELFLNSIDEENFDKSVKETTLTLDAKALADTLDVFADKMKDNDELNDALSDMIEESTGYEYDFSDLVSLAAPMLKDADFELTMTVIYDGGNPTALEIDYEENGSQQFEAVFEFADKGDARNIIIEVTANGSTGAVDLMVTKTKSGIEFDGTISIPGSDNVTISGNQEIDGNDISGSINMAMLDQTVTVDYQGTVTIGMPDDVEDDSRFEVNTGDATVSDLNDLFGGNLGSISDLPSLID